MENIAEQIVNMQKISLTELEERYEEVFNGQNPPFLNKAYLVRRIAYRLQEKAFGTLSGKAENKMQELIKKFDPVNNKALRSDKPTKLGPRDQRVPIPGTVIAKEYKGQKYEVKILEKGFELNNKVFKSLTAVAKEITGSHWNGYLFFNL